MSASVWFWRYGVPDVEFEFPYFAQSPISYQNKEFKTLKDVWDEVKEIVKEGQGSQRSIGQDLFFLLPTFADPNQILEAWHYEMIYEYQASKCLNLPIAPSLDQASADKVDSFLVLESELTNINNYEQKKYG
ncbi:TPA: hypothetical protein DE059_02825 [Candidatus Peribacteria bacterium]|nr:hypothetical protein [Candidatus Peribacteria bacterium]